MIAPARILFPVAATVWCCALAFQNETHAATNLFSLPKRTLTKEPSYQSVPKYSLLILGTADDSQVWMVEDGKRLFVDKNANGDLTDDGSPIEPSNFRSLGSNQWDFDYLLTTITPADGSRHTDFRLRRWNYSDMEDSYGLSLSVAGHLPMYAGWFGTFWSTNSAEAPMVHFGGPFTPRLLRGKEFTIGAKRERLSLCFLNSGSGPGAESRVSIEALPSSLAPTLNIEWPTAAGQTKRRTSHVLSERCCYWEFYTTAFEMPEGVVPGTAKLTVEFASGLTPIELKKTVIEAPVVKGSSASASTR